MAHSDGITYQQSLQMRPSKLAEVVGGELRNYTRPPREHSRVLESLRHILWSQINRQVVDVWTTSFALLIREQPALTFREPDLGMFVKARRVMRDRRYVITPPDLLVEAFHEHPHKGPLDERIADYEHAGVPELWLIDLSQAEWKRLLRKEGRLVESDTLRSGLVSPTLFPAAKVPLLTLWATLEKAQIESGYKTVR
jgi:Uma2 family endonuclease